MCGLEVVVGNLKGLHHVTRDAVVEKNTVWGLGARWSHDVATGLDDCLLRTHGL